MTTLPVDDRAMESALADLALTAPPNVAANVLVEVGLAERHCASWKGEGATRHATPPRGSGSFQTKIARCSRRPMTRWTGRAVRRHDGSPCSPPVSLPWPSP